MSYILNSKVMRRIIKISELTGVDIRFRKNADHIRNSIAGCAVEIELDFDGVEFISRAFADEVYTIVKENNDNIALINMAMRSMENSQDLMLPATVFFNFSTNSFPKVFQPYSV